MAHALGLPSHRLEGALKRLLAAHHAAKSAEGTLQRMFFAAATRRPLRAGDEEPEGENTDQGFPAELAR